MNPSEVAKTLKRIDPIWKRLRFNRIWVLFFAAFTVFYLCYSVKVRYLAGNRDASLIWPYLLYVAIWIGSIIGQFKQEQYWKRIGQRRLEALRDGEPFLATNQPPSDDSTLTLPISLRLRWNRIGVIVARVLGLIILCSTAY